MSDYMNFTPRFVTWACPACTKEFKQDECYGNGKYCAPNLNRATDSFIKGKDIIYEDLRQMCFHSQMVKAGTEDLWWDYIKYAHMCGPTYISPECSEYAHNVMKQDFQVT